MSEVTGFSKFMGSDQGKGIAGAAGGIIDTLSPQQKTNDEFLSRNQNIAGQLNKTAGLTKGISNAALMSGNPIAMAAGAAMKIGSGLTKSATDEFGVVKEGLGNKLKSYAGAMFNPLEMTSLLNQDDRREAKTTFANTEVATAKAENTRVGNQISNSVPRYTAPSYGRKGLKLTSKFSNNG